MSDSPRSEIVIREGRAYHLGLAADELASQLFLVGDPARAYRVAARFDSVDHEVKHREYVTLTGSYRGVPMSVIGTGIGADNIEIAMVESYVLNDFDLETCRRVPGRRPLTVIRVGTSGGARAEVDAGTLVITAYAIGLDSTALYFEDEPADAVVSELGSRAAAAIEGAIATGSRAVGTIHPYAAKASTVVVEALERHAATSGAAHLTGVTVTSPGFYGASDRYIEGLSNTVPDIKGLLGKIEVGGFRVLNFEMESSLLFTLARQMGYRAATICPIASNPVSHDQVPDYAPFIETSIGIALDAMVELA